VHVCTPAERARGRPGIRVHRAPLRQDETSRVNGIPATTPPRTLLDLAAELPRPELEQAIAAAERRHLASRSKLAALLARYPGRRGTRTLRALVESPRRFDLTRSKAEKRLLHLLRAAKLPVPDANVQLEGYEVDFLWRDAGLVVEVDGFAFHSDRGAFEADRLRDAELVARGLTVIRVTWRQMAEEPEAVVARLARALTRLGA
jgi:very-short-patch-repair endonuclease